MELKRIEKTEFDKFFNLLENDFCLEERKAKEDELAAFDNPKFSPNFIYDEGKLVGYITLWNFETFVFIEHFAVLKETRGTGCGSRFLKEFASNQQKQIVLEVELPETEVAVSRIRFYEHLGFVVNKYPYAQPSYHKHTQPVPMHVMTYQTELSQTEFDDCVLIVKHNVYDQ